MHGEKWEYFETTINKWHNKVSKQLLVVYTIKTKPGASYVIVNDLFQNITDFTNRFWTGLNMSWTWPWLVEIILKHDKFLWQKRQFCFSFICYNDTLCKNRTLFKCNFYFVWCYGWSKPWWHFWTTGNPEDHWWFGVMCLSLKNIEISHWCNFYGYIGCHLDK